MRGLSVGQAAWSYVSKSTSFTSNQTALRATALRPTKGRPHFRLFLHSTAYVLIHSLQNEVLAHTRYAQVTMKTIQLNILKTVAWVKELKTKVKIELPRTFAQQADQKKAFDILCPSG